MYGNKRSTIPTLKVKDTNNKIILYKTDIEKANIFNKTYLGNSTKFKNVLPHDPDIFIKTNNLNKNLRFGKFNHDSTVKYIFNNTFKINNTHIV